MCELDECTSRSIKTAFAVLIVSLPVGQNFQIHLCCDHNNETHMHQRYVHMLR